MSDLRHIASLAEEQIQAELEVANLKEQLQIAEENLRFISEDLIPEAMDVAGVEEFTLSDGRRVTIAREYKGHISEENTPAAFGWLRKKEFDGIIKRNVSFAFGRGDDKLADTVIRRLLKAYPDLDIKDKASVHHMTLNAFIRERLEDGDDLPLEAFGVFERRYAKIAEVKVKKKKK